MHRIQFAAYGSIHNYLRMLGNSGFLVWDGRHFSYQSYTCLFTREVTQFDKKRLVSNMRNMWYYLHFESQAYIILNYFDFQDEPLDYIHL